VNLICLVSVSVCRSNAQGLELSELMRRLADAARDGRRTDIIELAKARSPANAVLLLLIVVWRLLWCCPL